MSNRRRVSGSIISGAWIVAFGREFLIGRPPGETIEFLGQFLSPQSFFAGMVALGVGALVFCGWPIVVWLWKIPARRKERRLREIQLELERTQEFEENRTEETLKILDRLISLLQLGVQSEERRILQEKLQQHGLAVPDYAEMPHSSATWLSHAQLLRPHIEHYGYIATQKRFDALMTEHHIDAHEHNG